MSPYRIAGVELDTWESNFVETTVAVASGIEIAQWQYESDSDRADVVLVNAQTNHGESFLKRNSGDRPVVIRCVDETATDKDRDNRALSRPFGYARLIALLQGIETELRGAGDANGADFKPAREKSAPLDASIPTLTTPAATPVVTARNNDSLVDDAESTIAGAPAYIASMVRPAKRFFEVTRLLGVLKHIVHQDRAIRISHPIYPTITVFPTQRYFTARRDPLDVPEMFRESALAFRTRDVDQKLDLLTASLTRHEPLWKLFYCATLHGSEGRLLPHYQPEDRLHLLDAPDFTAVPSTPEHVEIADYMTRNAASLEEIVRATSADVRTVIDFCNACEEIGLLDGYSSEPRGAMVPPPEDDARDHVDEAVPSADDDTGSTSIIERVKTLFR